MLLKKWKRVASDDRGAVIIPVIALVAIGVVVGAMLSSSVIGGLTFASTTKAAVQAQAAADGGVAAARSGLYSGNCPAQPTPSTYTSTGSLTYSAVVQRFVNGLWQTGCPASLTPQVRILSTGWAVNSEGQTYGDPTIVEAIYNFEWPGVSPSGVAIYLYGGGVVEANSTLDLSESPGAGLEIKKGNFVCDKNNTVLNGNVLIVGNLDLGHNSCAINGDASVSGAVTLGSKGTISGNLIAGSVSPNPPGSKVGGTVTIGAVPVEPAPWTDVDYTPGDWVTSSGDPYQVVTLSGSGCLQHGGWFGGVGGTPTIINALGCPDGIQVTNNTTFKLTSDVVIFANVFDWGSINQLNFASSDTTERRIWFVTPDAVADAQPTCTSSQGSFAINNSFQIQSPVDAMLYTPCAFDGKNGFAWRGQLYAGTYSSVMNNPTFTFVPMGIAGYDLGSGASTPILTTPQPGSLVSNRNVLDSP